MNERAYKKFQELVGDENCQDTGRQPVDLSKEEMSCGGYRGQLISNLDAAKEAILRCTVERDSSLAEYAHLFAYRLEQQVVAVIEDGLEALSLLEEAEKHLDEETKKRLMNYVHLALHLKGLEEEP